MLSLTTWRLHTGSGMGGQDFTFGVGQPVLVDEWLVMAFQCLLPSPYLGDHLDNELRLRSLKNG